MAGTAVIYDLIARDSASRVFSRVGRSADGMNSKMAKIAKVAAGAGAALVALGAGAAEAADKASEFQTSMTKIQTLAGASAKDVASLTKQVLKLAPSTQQGPQALSEALYHLKAVGMDNAKAMKSLKVASDLAAVGGADLEDTTNALAGAWRTGIKGAGSFSEAAKTVNAVLGAGNMTMEDFNDAIGTGILPSAKTFGLSMSQVGAALALFTDEGVPANSAATRLRMSMSLLGAPSAAAEKQLGKIGLTGLKLADAMRGPNGIIGAIQLLKDHLDASGLSASQQSQILSRAFGGGKSSSAILSMVNNLDVLKIKQDQVNKSTGHYAVAVKTQRQTAQAQWKILTSSLETLTVQLGVKLLPPITGFFRFLSQKALPEAEKVSTAIGGLIPVDRIKTAAGQASSVLSGFFKNAAKTSGVSGLFGSLTKQAPKASKSYSTTADLSNPALPYGNVAAKTTHGIGTSGLSRSPYGNAGVSAADSRATQGLAKSPYGNSSVSNAPSAIGPYGNVAAVTTKGKAPSRAQQIAKTVTNAIDAIDWHKLGPAIGKGLGTALDWVVSHGVDLSKKIAKAIGGVDWVDVGKSLGSIALPTSIGFIDNLFAPLFTLGFWKKHWLDTILAVISVIPFGKVFDVGGTLLSKIPWGKLGEVVSKGLDKIPWGKIFSLGDRINWSKVLTLGDFGPAVGRWTTGVAGKIEGAFSGARMSKITGWIGQQFSKLGGWISNQVALLPTRIGVAFLDLGKWLTEHVPGLGNSFTRAIAKAFGRFSLYQTGLNLIEGLYNGVASETSKAYTWVKTHWVDPLINDVKSLFGVHSPSTVFAEIGGWLVVGLKNGIIAGAKGIGGWVGAHMVSPVTSRFSAAGSWLVGKGSAAVSGLKSGVIAGAKGLGGWITSHVVSPVTSRFSGAGSWLVGRGSQAVSGLKSGVLGGAKAIGSWAYNHVAQPLTSRFSAARTWLTGRGSQLISGLKSGISGAIKGIGTWVKSHIVDPVVNAVKHYFGIHSPSTVMAGLGGHLVAGLVKGLATTDGASIVSKVFGSMPKALGALVKKGLVHIEQLPGKALSALGGLGGDILGLLGFSGGSGASGSNQALGKQMMLASGWSAAQWPALKALWTRESGWNARAKNPSSGAYGIPQSLPASKMASAGKDWLTNPATQIKWGLGYILSRYGSPAAAWAHETKVGWYAKGGLAPIGQTAWVGERGPELMQVTPRGTRIIPNGQSMAMASGLGIRIPGYASGTVSTAQQRVADAQDNLARAKRRRLGVQAAETRLRAAKQELANTKKTTKTTVSNALANGFLKTVTTGTASAIASAVKSINTKLQAAGAGSLVGGNNKTAGKLEALATKKSSIASQITAANQYASDQSSSLASFLDVSGSTATSVNDLAIQMEQQQTTARKFAAEVAALSKKGLDKTLLQEIAAQGPGGSLSAILAQANSSDVNQLNKLAKSQTSLTSSFGKTMADAMYDSGAQAGKGFLTGLQAQEKAIQAEMDKLGAGMVKSIKKKLKIKSPSRVMRDEVGRQIGAGLVAGIDAHHPAVRAAAGRLAAAATNVRARQANGGAAQGATLARVAEALERVGALSDRPVNVHLHYNDATLHDLMRVEVDNGLDELGTALGVTA
ncbi:phage tail tape measure protein [Streptomyces sp. DW26H14]|uniref:phage tail tape measure protein n=1 Tax=Streptomyces sp. DW26H14 TaxID=3435395 RepID=UPI00403E0F57